jgi:hypothetical protein
MVHLSPCNWDCCASFHLPAQIHQNLSLTSYFILRRPNNSWKKSKRMLAWAVLWISTLEASEDFGNASWNYDSHREGEDWRYEFRPRPIHRLQHDYIGAMQPRSSLTLTSSLTHPTGMRTRTRLVFPSSHLSQSDCQMMALTRCLIQTSTITSLPPASHSLHNSSLLVQQKHMIDGI